MDRREAIEGPALAAPAPRRRPEYEPRGAPPPIDTVWRRLRAWLALTFADHGVFRLVYLNLHRIGRDSFRSAQPAPHHLARYRRLGVRTVVSLRGARDLGGYALERAGCARLGLAFDEIRLRSRDAPSRETLEAAAALIARIEYPAVFHCKSGADRAGLMAALVMILREGADGETARRQLGLRFGHVRQGPTGVLDAFLDAYVEAEARVGGRLDFMTWVREAYDPDAVRAGFREAPWARLLIDRVLRRE